jgi:anaerobic selenocysteine-containing dehydrogenase
MQANDLARQILEDKPYPVKALWANGMNLRMFNGDREMVLALEKLDFFVDVDLFLTDTAKYADIVLPCCSSFERSEFKVFGGGYAQWTEPVIPPLGESRPDDEIICELARRLELDDELLKAGPGPVSALFFGDGGGR